MLPGPVTQSAGRGRWPSSRVKIAAAGPAAFGPNSATGPVGVEVVHRQITRLRLGGDDGQIGLVILEHRPAAIDLPRVRFGGRLIRGGRLSFDHDSGDAREFRLRDELDRQAAVGHAHAVGRLVEGVILAHRGEHVEVLEKRLALHLGAEDPFALFGVTRLAQFQRHAVRAVGNVDVVRLHAVTHGLIDRVMVGRGEAAVGELGHLAPFDSLGQSDRRLADVLQFLIPAGLIPRGLGQGGDVRREDAGAPVDAHQAGAAVFQGVGGVAAHAAGPRLRHRQAGIVFHPRNGPLRPALRFWRTPARPARCRPGG